MLIQYNQDTFLRDDVVNIARELVGSVIVTEVGGHVTSGRIIETEAYRGRDDKGCHSHVHSITERTKVMFEEGGLAYVYICYGMHRMINVVTNVKGQADAILFRAIEPLEGIDIMKKRRGKDFKTHHLSGGPGKVSQCLGIDKQMYGLPFFDKTSPIRLYKDDSYEGEIMATPRVGMSALVEEYANMPWRFYAKGNPYVSRPLQLEYNY